MVMAYYSTTIPKIRVGSEEVDKNIVWLTIDGANKREILEGLGFKVGSGGVLMLKGKKVKALDEDVDVKADDVKAVLPGSLTVISDLSEIEMYLETK